MRNVVSLSGVLMASDFTNDSKQRFCSVKVAVLGGMVKFKASPLNAEFNRLLAVIAGNGGNGVEGVANGHIVGKGDMHEIIFDSFADETATPARKAA